jgi:hypothetical protein
MMARSYDFGECRGGKFQMTRVALVIAVGELGRDLSQVALTDWLSPAASIYGVPSRPRLPSEPWSGANTSLNVVRALGIALRGLRSLARRCVDPPGSWSGSSPKSVDGGLVGAHACVEL